MSDTEHSTPLINAIDGFILKEPAYFCIPGHRFQRGVPEEMTMRFGDFLFSYDLTEADGLDDLNDPKAAIKESLENAARVFGSDRTWFLVNGTSSGVEAMILSAVSPNEKIIVARNAHRSALAGLILSGAVPVWVAPHVHEKMGFSEGVTEEDIEEAFKRAPDAKAVFITSPTYYGKASPVRKIAEVCHAHNVPLLVDAAHGAHFRFHEELPEDALSAGADMTAESTHKTLFSMTQSSMLHYRAERKAAASINEETGEEEKTEELVSHIDQEKVEKALKLVTTSSPSYILMSSLDACTAMAAREGAAFTEKGIWLAKKLRKGLSEIPGVDVYGGADRYSLKARDIDTQRVVFSLAELGFSGYEVKERLFNEAQTAMEMADERNVVAVVTGANTEKEILQLIMAVIKLSGETPRQPLNKEVIKEVHIPKSAMTPRDAYFAKKIKIKADDCLGRIAGEQLSVYPPGIPFVVPGEIIDEEIMQMIKGITDEISVVEC